MAFLKAIALPFPSRTILNGASILMTLLLFLVAFMVLTPLILMTVNSFQVGQPGEEVVYGLDGWQIAFTSPGTVEAMVNTFNLSITRQLVALVIGVVLAWVLARTDIPMKGTLEFLFWLSFFLPALPITMGWILLLDPKHGLLNQGLLALGLFNNAPFNIYSFWGIIWAHLTASTIGIKVMLLTPAFRNLDAALEESSLIAGASALGTLFRVVVPLMMPAILVSSILGLIRSLESFEIELILGVPVGIHVYSTKIHELMTWEPPQFPPATALSTVFLGILLLLVALQRLYLGKRIYTTLTGRGFSVRVSPLGRWKYPAFAIVLMLGLVATFVPVGLLIMGTFMNVFGFFNLPETWTLNNWRAALEDPVLTRSIWNTIVVGFGAGAVGVFFYSFIAYVIVKSQFAGRTILDFLSWLPASIPGIVLGVGLLWTFLLTDIFTPIYGTIYLLIIAMVIKSIPLGSQLIRSVLLQVGNDLEEASWISGGGWFCTYRRILLPLLLPALITVGLVTFLSAVRDISTVVLLSTGKSRTLSLLMLDFTYGAEFERATVVAVMIVALVVVAALVARIVGGQIGIRQ